MTQPLDFKTPISQQALSDALIEVLSADHEGLLEARSRYGDSWMRRGGTSAMHNIFRKTDRLENLAEYPSSPGVKPYELFEIILNDAEHGQDGMLDTIRDLRRYLALTEAHILARGRRLPESRDNQLAARKPQRRRLVSIPHDAAWGEAIDLERSWPAVPVKEVLQSHVDLTGQDRPFGFDREQDERPLTDHT